MTKKRRIKFHNKEFGLLEARLYLIGLNLGILNPNLNYEEKLEYTDERKRENERGLVAKKFLDSKSLKKITLRLNERKYLANILERKINAEENLRKIEYCEKHGGHIRGTSFNNISLNTQNDTYICSRCGSLYGENSQKKLINPFISQYD